MQLATSPTTWGVDLADAAGNPAWSDVLDDIARSGTTALELGPVGYLPEDAQTLRRALSSRGLHAVGSFVFEDLHDPDQHEAVLATAQRASRTIADAGGALLVIIDRPGAARAATAGRSDVAPRLDATGWAAMVALIERVGDVARDHGLRPAVHPHAGSFIEFADEIQRLVADTTLDVCLDTGHQAIAGVSPVALVDELGGRVGHVHLKDVDGTVLDRMRTEPLDFWAAVAAGLFVPLGAGIVDVPGVVAALRRVHYDGFATIEQDRVPGRGSPLDDVQRSLALLDALSVGGSR